MIAMTISLILMLALVGFGILLAGTMTSGGVLLQRGLSRRRMYRVVEQALRERAELDDTPR